MSKLIRTHKYKKRELEFLAKNPQFKERYYRTLELLESNPLHPSLRLHKLKGNLSDMYSVSINMKYRILLHLMIIKDEVFLIDIGIHDEIY